MIAQAPLLVPARPLHLVHLTGGCGPQAANGIGRAVYHLSEAQRALGHDVEVQSERAAHVGGHRPPGIWQSPLTYAKGRLARSIRQVSPLFVQELLARRPDLVHLHSIHVPENVSLGRYLREANVPYCVTVHGGLSRAAQQRGRMKKAAMWWLGEREYLDGALFVHALTRDEANDIKAYGVKAPTVVAPNGIDPEALPRARRPEALFALAPELAGHRVFMFMGRLAPVQKGLDLLLEGLSLANVPDSRLVLMGPDWRNGRRELQRMVHRLGLETCVRFLDVESPERCADLVAGADVFVHTSRWEGVALAVLEAAVWEKPCLLTKAADPNDALGQAGGALVVDSTPESVAEGLRLLSSIDRTHLAMMGHRARSAVVSKFKWSLTARTLIQAYRDNAHLDDR